jgi:aminodeoxyfutalosine synthase
LALKPLLEKSPVRDIADKVMRGRRLDEADALRLYETPDIHVLGMLADHVRRRLVGDAAFYNINRHIDYSNVCVADCRFCAYSRSPGEKGAWELSREEIVKKAREAREKEGVTELHVVGGLHPGLSFQWYEGLLRDLKAAVPDVHLKCFTAVEIHYFSETFRMTHAEVLRRLMESGLGSLPGGGAEIFHPEVREKICPGKADAEQFLAVHRAAHVLGLKTNVTMLYGHVETYAHRVDHLARLRALQDETQGFQVFIPLAFHPENTGLEGRLRVSGIEDLKNLAVSRLFLDNFPHLKAYWVTLGTRLAQIALAFGVDDLDGTVMEETIHHMAGSDAPQTMTRAGLESLIREAGREPVERDSLYRPVKT